jgi:hypothetical protein
VRPLAAVVHDIDDERCFRHGPQAFVSEKRP